MATFQFSNHTIELDFCGQEHFSLNMTSEMQKRYKAACERLVEKSESGANDFDELCDQIIGEEDAADRILNLKGSYTFFDAIDVFKYISGEINAAIRDTTNGYSPTGADAPSSLLNRKQRRAIQRTGR